jgi:hypothetical protein
MIVAFTCILSYVVQVQRVTNTSVVVEAYVKAIKSTTTTTTTNDNNN